MFANAIKKAHEAVEGAAVEAAFKLSAVLLAFGAFLFAACGIAIWLSLAIPIYAALLIIAVLTALCAALIYYFGNFVQSPKDAASDEDESEPAIAMLTKSLSAVGAPMDVVAAGLFARQFKKSPMATLAATAAVGAVIRLMSEAKDDEI